MKKRNLLWIFLLVFLMALPTFWRILGAGYFPMHDDLQIGRLYQMDLCFRDGQIPCRWVPDMGYGYGYPLFNYYPPLPFYLGEILHLTGLSFIIVVKILFILSLIFSGFFAYLLGKELWGKYGGFVVAAFYLYAPYHAVDVYVRGAMNEFYGLVFFPAVFWAVFKIVKEGKKFSSLWLSFLFALLLLSHNLMAFFTAPLLAIWTLFLIWYFKKSFKVIWRIFFSGLYGAGLAAFFTLPVFFERKLVSIETMFMGYFNYLAHFATVKQLFFSRFWGYGASTWGPEDGMPFPVGQLHWGLGIIAVIVFVYFFFRQRKKSKDNLAFKNMALVILFFVLFLGTAFLAHERSTFAWKLLPVLASMQFPWRFVAFASFFVSLLAGSFFIFIKNEKKALILSLVMIIGIIAFNVNFFKPEKILKTTDTEKLFSAKGWNKLQTDAIFDYLPKAAKFPPAGPAPYEPFFFRGEGGEIKNFQKGTNWQTFDVRVDNESLIRLPLYDFPNWQVLVNGKKTLIDNKNELGLITFRLEPGIYKVEARLKNTPIRTVANLISLFSWLALLIFIFKKRIIKLFSPKAKISKKKKK